jgi:signal transduction histidine kinase
MPMVFERRAFGILGLESFKVQKQWHEDDIALLTIAGEIFSNALKRKEAQEEIQRMLEKERELNALKSSFVSTASHEFRTPLTTILSTAELLERYEGRWSIERREELFNRIRAAIKNMTSLLDDVLLVNKADAGRLEFKPTSFDFRALCLNLVEELKLGSGADHHFELDLTEGLFWGDEKLLRQIITNLLTNGIKYSSEGSTILFKLWYDSGDAILEIADQGIGIPEEALSHLFEVFYRAENVGDIKGTGLGLTIVKKCLDAHAAWIDIQSQVGKGTSCKLWIPLLKPN